VEEGQRPEGFVDQDEDVERMIAELGIPRPPFRVQRKEGMLRYQRYSMPEQGRNVEALMERLLAASTSEERADLAVQLRALGQRLRDEESG
jgi:hypothetical protein